MEGGYRAWRTHQPWMRRLTGAAQQLLSRRVAPDQSDHAGWQLLSCDALGSSSPGSSPSQRTGPRQQCRCDGGWPLHPAVGVPPVSKARTCCTYAPAHTRSSNAPVPAPKPLPARPHSRLRPRPRTHPRTRPRTRPRTHPRTHHPRQLVSLMNHEPIWH